MSLYLLQGAAVPEFIAPERAAGGVSTFVVVLLHMLLLACLDPAFLSWK